MNPAAFFALMRSGAHNDVLRAIERNPFIVMDTWTRPWGEHWDIDKWLISGDVGFDSLPWAWAFWHAREHIGYTSNFQPAKPPTSPIRLYRGAPHERRFGLGWTTKYEYAHKYAVSNLVGIGGNVYLHWAWGEELFAHTGLIDGNDEYVLDARYLNDSNVARLPLSAPAYSALHARCVTTRPASTLLRYRA